MLDVRERVANAGQLALIELKRRRTQPLAELASIARADDGGVHAGLGDDPGDADGGDVDAVPAGEGLDVALEDRLDERAAAAREGGDAATPVVFAEHAAWSHRAREEALCERGEGEEAEAAGVIDAEQILLGVAVEQVVEVLCAGEGELAVAGFLYGACGDLDVGGVVVRDTDRAHTAELPRIDKGAHRLVDWHALVAVIAMAGLDFSMIEARVLAAMSDKRVRGVILDIESAGGEIVNPQLDLYRMAFMEKPRAEKVAKKAPPAYLKHDPTKRHSRRRKGK